MYARLPESAGLAAGVTPSEHEHRLLNYYRNVSAQAAGLPDAPRFTLLLDDSGGGAGQLDETLRSIALQLWPGWEICYAPYPGAPAPEALTRLHTRYPDRVALLPEAADAATALRAAFGCATGGYAVVVAAGDRLYPSALAELVRAIAVERELSGDDPPALYSDERTIDEAGRPVGDPVFKPDWSPLLLRSGDYVGGLAVYRSDFLAELGGPLPGREGRHALAVAAGSRHPMTHVPHVLVQRREAPLMAAPETPRAPLGKASVVIPTKDQAELLAACVRSVLERTSHPDFEVVLVDNGTTDTAARAVLDRVSDDPRVRVIAAPGPFNFARLCNLGARASTGDTLVLLNNDTEVLTGSWLTTLCAWAAEPGVGAVGAQLRYADGRVQHAGVAGMATAGTGHLFAARDPGAETPLHLIDCPREVLAVTGACLAIDRATYLSVGGLDERLVPNDSGDIDLCLRLRDHGKVTVYAPQAVLTHHESPSRGRSFVDFERFYLMRRWPAELLCDPYLNPNLARSTRYEPDPRFDIPDIPPELFSAWLASGVIPL